GAGFLDQLLKTAHEGGRVERLVANFRRSGNDTLPYAERPLRWSLPTLLRIVEPHQFAVAFDDDRMAQLARDEVVARGGTLFADRSKLVLHSNPSQVCQARALLAVSPILGGGGSYRRVAFTSRRHWRCSDLGISLTSTAVRRIVTWQLLEDGEFGHEFGSAESASFPL